MKEDKLLRVKCIKSIGTVEKGSVRDMYESTFNALKDNYVEVESTDVEVTDDEDDDKNNNEEEE